MAEKGNRDNFDVSLRSVPRQLRFDPLLLVYAVGIFHKTQRQSWKSPTDAYYYQCKSVGSCEAQQEAFFILTNIKDD